MAEVVIRISDGAADPERLDELAVELRDVLLDDLAEAVERRGAPVAPPGSRGTELLEIGVLVVQIALDTGLLTELAQRIRDWRDRQGVSQVEVAIGDSRLVLSGASPDQQQALVDHFIRATSGTRR